jgi:hypothetical protein
MWRFTRSRAGVGRSPRSPPARSKLLRLHIGVNGLSAIQGILSIGRNGSSSTAYRLNPGYGVVRFWFMVSTLTEADYV